MPKINLLSNLITRGVDMKSNALLLSNRKLHAATNLVWDESVIRTRPEFDYIPLGVSGTFQGASSYAPRKGLSYAPLSDAEGGLLTVVAGAVFFHKLGTCEGERISRAVFCDKGDVNIFQAENYAILQCRNTSTFWWDGSDDIIESPGDLGENWNDREMPQTEIVPVAPVADIPICDPVDGQIIFNFVDADTENELPFVKLYIKRNDNIAKERTSDSNGRVRLELKDGNFTYDASLEGYFPITAVPFTMTAGMIINVRLRPVPENLFLGLIITLSYDGITDVCDPYHDCNAAVFDVYANEILLGRANLNNLGAPDGGARSETFTISEDDAEDIAAASSDGETITLRFECATDDPEFDPVPYDGQCHPGVGHLVVTTEEGALLYDGCPDEESIDIDVNPAP